MMMRILLGVILGLPLACRPETIPSARSITYGFELEQCSANAKTCAESITCENEVRTRYGRPLRSVERGCK